jgi:hypothetical protein
MRVPFSRQIVAPVFLVIVLLTHSPRLLAGPQAVAIDVPRVTKVEPPNWWIGLTPDLMVLLSGHGLQVTKAACNLPEVIVERTQATQGGDYLFVWLKLGPHLRSGTIVCHLATNNGETSFELPVSNREATAQRFHGFSSDDVLYLIMPDRFANGDPTNDEPAEFPGSHDRSKPRSWHGGYLRGIREHIPYLKVEYTIAYAGGQERRGADYHGLAQWTCTQWTRILAILRNTSTGVGSTAAAHEAFLRCGAQPRRPAPSVGGGTSAAGLVSRIGKQSPRFFVADKEFVLWQTRTRGNFQRSIRSAG